MSERFPDEAEEEVAQHPDGLLPDREYQTSPMVGLGGSAGGIKALKDFFETVPADSGLAFAVVLHLSPEHESTLAELLQRSTSMRVVQVVDTLVVEPNTVYVIPPRLSLKAVADHLELGDLPPGRGRHVAVDLFFRTLADTYGPRAAAVVLSGADGDGAIGIKRIKDRGGLTIAQDPDEAEHGGMPRAAMATGMIDWVLPVAEIPARLLEYFKLEDKVRLPPLDGPPPSHRVTAAVSEDEAALRDVLTFLRTRTGRDFSYYKRATILRRIGRRMQVNGVSELPDYLNCLRTRPGEAGALLQDLLISVTNFFRDSRCFAALELEIPALFAGKTPDDAVRVWVPACATGEEAYSVAILLAEQVGDLDAAPTIQIFATDLDEEAVRTAREAVYPPVIEVDVSEERLKRFFVKEHRGYRVRRELRELVLFAQHDVLKDSPFSRLDLISCRNLLIYLNRDAQARLFDIFHFALVPGGRLFLGSSETVEDDNLQFNVLDKKHRLYQQRPAPRMGLPLPSGPGTLALAVSARAANESPVVAGHAMRQVSALGAAATPPIENRSVSWGELHLRLLEQIGPPSILVDSEYDIVHLSPSAGRFLQFSGGEPSRNLLRAVNPSLRIELRAALYQAAQHQAPSEVNGVPVEIEGHEVSVSIRVNPAADMGAHMFLVVLQAAAAEPPSGAQEPGAQPVATDPVARHLDRELERLKAHLRDTVEQYEASTEELKASNEELQAMNEELRSATEELETSREELQSINEELTTVNQELKSKVEELAHANSDLHNLMDATAIATVFLDRELRITRFTPSAVALFNLIPTDVGRPLSDLKTQLRYRELGDDARRVLDKLVPIEREVGRADGSWFLARLLPYRTLDDRIAGVVLACIDITERKQAEEMRLWLSAVVTASSDAIISFSLDGTILSWNGGAERIFGHKAQEAIGRPLAILAPGDGAEQDLLLEKIAAAQPVENYECVRHRKDGSQLEVALTVSPIRDEAGKVMAGTALVRDVSAAKRAEEALRSSEERLRLVIENAREFAIFSTDLERRITSWNSGAQRLLGYSGEEALGQLADLIFVPEEVAAGAPAKEAATALAEGRASDDRFHVRKDGSRFWASGAMMLMRDAAGEAVGFVKILRDQTAARESQQALERSQSDLLRALKDNEQARAQLQAADAAKDRFLAVLAHELRNPLASIDSAAALLAMQKLPAGDGGSAAEVVRRQAATMKRLLDDMLDVSRLKLGRLELHREKVLLGQIVDRALEATRPLLQASGHQLKVELPPYLIELDADPVRLGQVLTNLLSNAINYTPAGGSIGLQVRLEGEEAVIAVQDSGVGVDPAQLERIFEMFVQAQPAAEAGREGLGIGLALARTIVEMHGGRVQAASEGPGKGSEFRVFLPARNVDRPPTEAPAPPPVVAAKANPAKRGLILIADDNVDVGWAMSRLLELAGFATTCVSGGVEAVQESQRRKPDVAIIDIGMPDLNGHEVARRIRQAPWGKRMVMIAATGWGQESDQREAIAAGFDAHLTKPVDLRKLSAVIDDLLQRRRSPS